MKDSFVKLSEVKRVRALIMEEMKKVKAGATSVCEIIEKYGIPVMEYGVPIIEKYGFPHDVSLYAVTD